MKKGILSAVFMLAAVISTQAQAPKTPVAPKPADSTAAKKPASKIKSYDQVITKEAKSSKGLFTTHQVGDKYYFEIPKKHLGKERQPWP